MTVTKEDACIPTPPPNRFLSSFIFYSAARPYTHPELRCLTSLPVTVPLHVRFCVAYSAPHHLFFCPELFRCSHGEILSRCDPPTRPSICQLHVMSYFAPVTDRFLVMCHLHNVRPRFDRMKTFRPASLIYKHTSTSLRQSCRFSSVPPSL